VGTCGLSGISVRVEERNGLVAGLSEEEGEIGEVVAFGCSCCCSDGGETEEGDANGCYDCESQDAVIGK